MLFEGFSRAGLSDVLECVKGGDAQDRSNISCQNDAGFYSLASSSCWYAKALLV